jgi:CheY-like chemotaxis protein
MRIALVADSPGDIRWFRLTLEEIGIRDGITVFKTGLDAVANFRSGHPPELVVTDWKLPGLTFAEFVREFRSIPGCETTPIVVLTGVAYLIREEVLDLGALCCLEKPLDPDQLRELLQRIALAASA